MSKGSADAFSIAISLASGAAFVVFSLSYFQPSKQAFNLPDRNSDEDAAIIESLRNNLSAVTIIQQRTSCLGPCPSYTVNIHGNGTVIYHGGAYVRPMGVHALTVSNSEILDLLTKLDRTDFFILNDNYGLSGYDVPNTDITISDNGDEIKRVAFSAGGEVPEVLVYLRTEIEKVSGIEAVRE